MKSFLVIGMGKFGHELVKNLSRYDNEILIADSNEDKMSDLLSLVTSAKIGDCTKEETLKTFGIEDFDACIVCVFDDFQSSLEITDLLKRMGAKRVISLASTEIQAKFLSRNGADTVMYPDGDVAKNVAVSISNDSIFDYIALSDGYSIYEILPLAKWYGRSIKEVDVKMKHHISILAAKRTDGTVYMPTADYVFSRDEHLIIMGKQEDVDKITEN